MKTEELEKEHLFRFNCARWDCHHDSRKEVRNMAWQWLARGGYYPAQKKWPKA